MSELNELVDENIRLRMEVAELRKDLSQERRLAAALRGLLGDLIEVHVDMLNPLTQAITVTAHLSESMLHSGPRSRQQLMKEVGKDLAACVIDAVSAPLIQPGERRRMPDTPRWRAVGNALRLA